MSFGREVALRGLSFTYPSALEPLLVDLTVHFPRGFTGVVGANGAGKSTLLQLLTGDLRPSSGVVMGAADAIYCQQRTDAPPPDFTAFLDDYSADACELRGRLDVQPDFLEHWQLLSHGERKRAQIAHALWRRPDVLAIDEPTNHIDARARDLLIDALERFRGVGLIVSHDRALLDALCVQCLWLAPPDATMFPGNFTQAREQRSALQVAAVRARQTTMAERDRLQYEVVRRRDVAARADRKASKRGLSTRDHDAKRKIDVALVTGKDGQAGRVLKQLAGRAAQLEARLGSLHVTKEFEGDIWLEGSRSRRDHLFSVDANAVPLGDARELRHPPLAMRPADRVALVGPNGAGKSTLVRKLLGIVQVAYGQLVVLPQEVEAQQAQQILEATQRLPKERLGRVLNIVSRLGSRPRRLLESRMPSPGEIRKLLLALGMARAPQLIVMDEPTNHLDLPSIEALEEALSDCPCGLLLVSHDQRFLDRLTSIRWEISVDASRNSSLEIR